MSQTSWSAAWVLCAFLAVPSVGLAQTADPPAVPPPAPAAGSVPGTSAPSGGCPYAHRGYGHCHGGAIRWTATGLGVVGIGTAIAFEVAAVTTANSLQQMYVARDPNHSFPISSYPDLRTLQSQHDAYQAAAIGLFIGGGIFTAAATLMWLAPHLHHGCCRHAPPPVAFGVTPNSASVSLTF